jgi:hypothetical protein
VRKELATHCIEAMPVHAGMQVQVCSQCLMSSFRPEHRFFGLQHKWHVACFDVHHEAHDGFHGNAAGSSLFTQRR